MKTIIAYKSTTAHPLLQTNLVLADAHGDIMYDALPGYWVTFYAVPANMIDNQRKFLLFSPNLDQTMLATILKEVADLLQEGFVVAGFTALDASHYHYVCYVGKTFPKDARDLLKAADCKYKHIKVTDRPVSAIVADLRDKLSAVWGD